MSTRDMTALEDAIAAVSVQPTITIAQAGLILGVSGATVRRAADDGEIETIRVGRIIRVLSGPLKQKVGLT